MSARERAVTALVGTHGDREHGEAMLDGLEAAGLRVIEQPEPAYDVTDIGPMWTGDGWTVVADRDGEVTVVVADPDDHGGVGTYHLPAAVVAGISAAHIRAEDYR